MKTTSSVSDPKPEWPRNVFWWRHDYHQCRRCEDLRQSPGRTRTVDSWRNETDLRARPRTQPFLSASWAWPCDAEGNSAYSCCPYILIREETKSFSLVLQWRHTWASADFFPGEGKIFQGWVGAKTCYLSKKHLKDTIFFKKSRKTYYFGRPEGGGGGGPP